MAIDSYPPWDYFPRNARPPEWVNPLVALARVAEPRISTVEQRTGLASDDVLKELAPGLRTQGFTVEESKRKSDRIRRPVLYGRNGMPELAYEIDAFNDENGIAVEVEAGRAASNNATYRNIIRASLILDARHLVLILPVAYRFNNSGKTNTVRAYENGVGILSAIYASQRLALPFDGILLIGY